MLVLPTPTVETILDAERQFDGEQELVESAITQLVRQFPANTETAHILLKTVVINKLYSTNVIAVEALAEHIAKIKTLDQLLVEGAPEAIDAIAAFKIGKISGVLSFATKYCNWHNHDAYHMFDVNVEKCLCAYKDRDRFAIFSTDDFRDKSQSMSTRRENFFKAIYAFCDYYRVPSRPAKRLDKFLWIWGYRLKKNLAVVRGPVAPSIVVPTVP